MKINYNQTGDNRKKMVGLISESISEPVQYAGAPTFEYHIGAFAVTREGILEFDSAKTDLEQIRTVIDALKAEGFDYEGSDCLSIGYPADGFTDEVFANLEKLVASKAPLIKKALGVDELPIERGETELSFPWFRAGLTSTEVYAFAQFITALCKTAKEKKRVTAKAPDGDFENPAFAMRVWLIGLGMKGDDYKLARKLLVSCQDGNSAWRYGKPEKINAETDPAPVAADEMVLAAGEAPVEEVSGENDSAAE